MGEYDVQLTPKYGGCCRHRFWGWKEMLRYDLGSSAAGATMFSRVWWLLIIRLIFALWSLAAIVYGIIIMALGETTPVAPFWWWFISLGNWSIFSVTLYFWSFTVLSCREVRKGAHGPTNYGERWLWVNYEIAWALTWSCTLLFWLVVARRCTFPPHNCSNLTYYDFHAYGISLIWLLFEVFFNMMRWKWLHFLFPTFFLVAWCVAAAIFYAVLGVWPYAEQDPNQSSTLMVGLFYPILLLSVIFFHFCGLGFGAMLEKCYKGKRRMTDKDLEGDLGVQISKMCC